MKYVFRQHVEVPVQSIAIPLSNNTRLVIDGPRIPVETTSALDAICLNILHSTFAKFTSESWPQIINPPGVGVPKIVQTIEEFGHTRYDNEVTIKENPTPQEMEIVAAVNLLRATVQRLINPPKEPVI